MQARLFLILIFMCMLVVMLSNDTMNLFIPIDIILFEKKLQLNSEIVIALIMLSTLIMVVIVGLLNRIFFYTGSKKRKNKKTD
jgi:ABC-type glycerol-3-phosphate transport system permease component